VATPAPTVRGYQYLTRADARAAVAGRLSDPSLVHWTAAEIDGCVVEALRTWQALTGWYRERAALQIAPGTTFYDLTSSLIPQAPTYPINLFGYNVTTQDVASQILYRLLERQLTLAGGVYSWNGTDQFTLGQVETALQNRIQRFLGDSGCVYTYYLQTLGVAPPVSRFLLPDNVIDIRRLAWMAADGTRTTLWRDDEWGINAFAVGQSQLPSTPQVYAATVAPPISVQLAPPPANSGNIECVLVVSGPQIDLTAAGIVFNVPDDYVWGVKWGALADLLVEDGQSRDSERAAYCEKRYQEAVQLARSMPAVIQGQVLGLPVPTPAVFDLDAYQSGWQNAPPGTPVQIGVCGRNIVALNPPPAAAMNVTVDLVRNMPVPQADGDYLQIPRDVADVILDYAQHVASFKLAGEEFTATMQHYQNLIYAASEYNGRLHQLAIFSDALKQPAFRQTAEVPRL
jgi:hypothetical protein